MYSYLFFIFDLYKVYLLKCDHYTLVYAIFYSSFCLHI